MARVIKDNKAYDSGDATVRINGIETEVVEISYSTDHEHQLNYTLKRKATSWSQGKETPEGSMTLMMADSVRIQDAAGGKPLPHIKPFEIDITFTNDYNKVVNDTVIAKFKKTGREINGDMGLSYQYDLFVLEVEENNV